VGVEVRNFAVGWGGGVIILSRKSDGCCHYQFLFSFFFSFLFSRSTAFTEAFHWGLACSFLCFSSLHIHILGLLSIAVWALFVSSSRGARGIQSVFSP
jgi:hypothetical protein